MIFDKKALLASWYCFSHAKILFGTKIMKAAKLKQQHYLSLVALLALAHTTFSPIAMATSDTAASKKLSQNRQAQLAHIVKQDCGSCHGMTLKGGLGPALLPENLEGKTPEFLQYTILHGRTSTAMPPWKSLLTEQEALWIAEQLKQGKIANNE